MGSGRGGYGSAASKTVESANNFVIVIVIISIIFSIAFVIGCIFWCRNIAKSKNLSTNYMWFGLLGFVGALIVATMQAEENYDTYMETVDGNYYYQCPYCGSGLGQADVFCSKCGNRVR